MMKSQLYDVTLRDGNHALKHQLNLEFVRKYCGLADRSDSWAVEVGHGNGLGASSFLVGKSAVTDNEMLSTARKYLNHKKLAVHVIPGFATIERDLKPALDCGVDIFRVASHCTEASVSEKHINFLVSKMVIVHGVLMMSHMTSIENLIDQARQLASFGAQGIILMDSAGNFVPHNVKLRIEALKDSLAPEILIGFHAHNNLGLAIANATEASTAGATIIDGAAMGLGAGAGNAQLENVVAAFKAQEYEDREIEPFLELSALTQATFKNELPVTSSQSILSGLSGVFSGYAPKVKDISAELGIPQAMIWEALGQRKLVAGQESMIREIAIDLMNL